MDQQKEKTSYIYYYLLINFAANSKKSATFLKSSNCWQYRIAQGSENLCYISTFIIFAKAIILNYFFASLDETYYID